MTGGISGSKRTHSTWVRSLGYDFVFIPREYHPRAPFSNTLLAYINRGNAKGDLGQHFAAISDYDTAIRLKPDDASAYINRGVAKADLGQHRAAISDYDTAIRLKPDDALAYYNRGIAKYKLGRTSSAKRDFQTALKLAEQAGDESLKAKIMKALSIISER